MPTSKDAPVLADWVSLADLARMLGVSKQAVHKMASAGKFSTLHRLGQRPDYVISREEAESWAGAPEGDGPGAADPVPADPGA